MTSESPVASIQCPEIVQQGKKINWAPRELSVSIQKGFIGFHPTGLSVVGALCGEAGSLKFSFTWVKKKGKVYFCHLI